MWSGNTFSKERKKNTCSQKRKQRKTLCVCNLFVNSRLDGKKGSAENPEGLNGNDAKGGPKNGYEKK